MRGDKSSGISKCHCYQKSLQLLLHSLPSSSSPPPCVLSEHPLPLLKEFYKYTFPSASRDFWKGRTGHPFVCQGCHKADRGSHEEVPGMSTKAEVRWNSAPGRLGELPSRGQWEDRYEGNTISVLTFRASKSFSHFRPLWNFCWRDPKCLTKIIWVKPGLLQKRGASPHGALMHTKKKRFKIPLLCQNCSAQGETHWQRRITGPFSWLCTQCSPDVFPHHCFSLPCLKLCNCSCPEPVTTKLSEIPDAFFTPLNPHLQPGL